jgi:hypothetical protein
MIPLFKEISESKIVLSKCGYSALIGWFEEIPFKLGFPVMEYQIGDLIEGNYHKVEIDSDLMERTCRILSIEIEVLLLDCKSKAEYLKCNLNLIKSNKEYCQIKESNLIVNFDRLYITDADEQLEWNEIQNYPDYKDFKTLNTNEVKTTFEEVKEGIAKSINTKVNEWLYNQITLILDNVEGITFSSESTIENKVEQSFWFDISHLGVDRSEEFIEDLYDFLKENGFLDKESNLKSLKSLFNKNGKESIIWAGSKKSLGLFALNIPVNSSNRFKVISARFTIKGQNMTNIELINSGRNPKSKSDQRLIQFLKDR